MATFDSKDIVDRIIAGNGEYEGDPPVAQIVEFENAWGKTAWGVTWTTEPLASQRRYEIPSEGVNNPRVIWRRSPGRYGQGKSRDVVH